MSDLNKPGNQSKQPDSAQPRNPKTNKSASLRRKLAKYLGISFVGLVILGCLIGAIGYFYLNATLPKLTNVTDYEPSMVTEVYSRDLKKIAEYLSLIHISEPTRPY